MGLHPNDFMPLKNGRMTQEERLAARKDAKAPKCKRCRSANTTHFGVPPDKVFVTCGDCGHVWQICGGLDRRTLATVCGQPPQAGSNRCKYHGADAGRPFLNGRRAVKIPSEWQEGFLEALTNEDALSSIQDVALYEARLEAKLEELSDVPHGDWTLARKLYAKSNRITQDGIEAWEKLGEVLSEGASRIHAERQLDNLAERLRSQKQTEVSRIMRAESALTQRQWINFNKRLFKAISENVLDPAVQRKLITAILDGIAPATGQRTPSLDRNDEGDAELQADSERFMDSD